MKRLILFLLLIIFVSGCTNQINENYCEQDQDCSCGVHIDTGECFYGNNAFVDSSQQCPDFCTGIAGNFEIRCQNTICVQTSSGLNENYQNNTKHNNQCVGGLEKFDYAPVDLDGVTYIIPMGSVHGDHVSPTDHNYYRSPDGEWVDVYAPMGGVVTNMQHMGLFRADRFIMDDYHVTIDHGCGISSIFIHIDELSEKLAAVAPKDGEYISVNVEVGAGEVLGRYSDSIDYNVVDESVNINLINPDSYGNVYQHRVHITDPFDYFNEEVKARLIEKSLRNKEPFGGTIDYDVDGTLVGVWFQEETGGWKGITDDYTKYWSGHLAIVYHHIDTNHVVISFGTWDDPKNEGKQLGVKNNDLDPSAITVNSGLVKYELYNYDYYDGSEVWDGSYMAKGLDIRNYENVMGTVLFQLVEDRKLKMELFIDKGADEVGGFTSEALVYER